MTSQDLFIALTKQDLVPKEIYPFWWPKLDGVSAVASVILTQQSRWEKVLRSLENLEKLDLLSFEALAKSEVWIVAQAIVPSGLYNQKAKRVQEISKNIVKDFLNEDDFKESVTREWLLRQKGIGEESADSILNYYCNKEVMVVDAYTNRLLQGFGFTFESYSELQQWLVEGLDLEKSAKDLGIKKYEVYNLYHGIIVEYCKLHSKKTEVDISFLEI